MSQTFALTYNNSNEMSTADRDLLNKRCAKILVDDITQRLILCFEERAFILSTKK